MFNKKVRNKFLRRLGSAALTLGMLATTFLSTPLDVQAQIPALGENGMRVSQVFFDATKSPITFNKYAESLWDTYDDTIGKPEGVNYTLTLSSSTDAKMTQDGILQVDYEGKIDTTNSDNGHYDGSYTVWGVGGTNFTGTNQITFNIKTTENDANIANIMSVRFWTGGTEYFDQSFADWMSSSLISIDGVDMTNAAVADKILKTDGQFHEYLLNIPQSDFYQGMKIYFDRAEASGTVWFGPITYHSSTASDTFEDFIIANRTNSYQDPVDGSYPLLRSKLHNTGITDGSMSGCNIRSGRLWTMSTSDANIVSNTASGNVKALQIKYQKNANHITYARLTADETVTDEPLIAISLKGADNDAAVKVDNILNIALYNDGQLVKTIPFTEFYEFSNLETATHTDISADTYKTYYSKACDGINFDTVAFEVQGADTYNGTIFVQDIFFPRFSYAVNHYLLNGGQPFDTEYKDNVKYAEIMTYTDKSGTHTNEITGIEDTYSFYKSESNAPKVGDNYIVSSDSGKNILSIVYAPQKAYTINYYYDNVKDDSKTVTGVQAVGSTLTYTDQNITGYKLSEATPNNGTLTISENAADNVIDVYYVKDSFDYTIEYYYGVVGAWVIDDSLTENGTAEYGSTVKAHYAENVKDGYRLNSAVPAGTMTISEDESKNIIRIYYTAKDYDYTVEYYYNGVKDDTATVTGTAKFGSEVSYTEKGKDGYILKNTDPTDGKLTISSDPTKNVIKVYYEEPTYDYTVEYYYDGVKDDNATVTGAAKQNSEITYEAKAKDGYVLKNTNPENGKMTISNNATDNVLQVYYEKGSYGYSVEYYYDGVKDDNATVTGTAQFGSEISYAAKDKDGYVLKNTNPENGKLTLSGDSTKNVIKVYYEKATYGYTVEYYYDGVKDDNATVTGTAVYGSEVSYTAKEKEGYTVDTTTPANGKITISTDPASNVIKVYYKEVKTEVAPTESTYTVIYYKDGTVVDTVTSSGTIGSLILYTTAKEGCVFDKMEGATVIAADSSTNVLHIYFRSETKPAAAPNNSQATQPPVVDQPTASPNTDDSANFVLPITTILIGSLLLIGLEVKKNKEPEM